MAEFLEIDGGRPLVGEVRVAGAKNGVLPMLCAALLTGERCRFTRVPNIQDVSIALHLLETLGASVQYQAGTIDVSVPTLRATEASYSLVKALRASFWVLGPLLARGGAARVALPGGDLIGARPVDMHLSALTAMGADIKVSHGIVYAQAPQGLRGAEICLRFPSVGATHQVLMAASLAKGTTVIRGAAREPEVVALAQMLNQMGGVVEGAGTDIVEIKGKEILSGCNIEVIGDRVEAMTYLLAGLASKGAVTVKGIDPSYLGVPLDVLDSMGAALSTTDDSITAAWRGDLQPARIVTGPFPEFATDLQPLFVALCTQANGVSTIDEHVYEGRFGYVAELCRMGANITVERSRAIVQGPTNLSSAPVESFDIRAAAALVICALASEGRTKIAEIHHLRRGYEFLEDKLRGVGANIRRRLDDPEDYLYVGC